MSESMWPRVDLGKLVGKPMPSEAPKPREISEKGKELITALNNFTWSIPDLLKSDLFKQFCQNKLRLGIRDTDLWGLKKHIGQELLINTNNPRELSKIQVVTLSWVMEWNTPLIVINWGIKLELDGSGLKSMVRNSSSQSWSSELPDNSLSRWP
jgi:hypothetical protein